MAERPHRSAPTIYTRDQHSISRDNLDPDALKIMYRIIRHGHKAYLVGGGVRDLLLNKTPKDYDIATDATPRVVKDLFRNSRIIGRRFKLVHIFFGGGKIIQVSTFRDFSDPIDVQDEAEAEDTAPRDHRTATDNKFGTEETDAYRRDLTINALFYDLSTFSIIDYVGGMQDLHEGIIRIIGDPDERFREDPVRLIRVVRHSARSGFMIEPECRASIARNKELLLSCSTMRIFEEVKKDLLSGSCLSIFRLLAQTELLDLLLPELTAHEWFHLSDRSEFAHALRAADKAIKEGKILTASSLLALVVLFAETTDVGEENPIVKFPTQDEIAEQVGRCFTRLSVPKRERERVEDILFWWHKIYTQGSSARIGSLPKNPIYHDLVDFVALLNCDGQYQELFDLVRNPKTHAVAHGAEGENDDGGPRKRRRRSSRTRRGRNTHEEAAS